jgi:hypothetical protein
MPAAAAINSGQQAATNTSASQCHDQSMRRQVRDRL